jgi:hypothetical protein
MASESMIGWLTSLMRLSRSGAEDDDMQPIRIQCPQSPCRDPVAGSPCRSDQLSGGVIGPRRTVAGVRFWQGTPGAWLCKGCGTGCSTQRQYVCPGVQGWCIHATGTPRAQESCLNRSPSNKGLQPTASSVRSCVAPASSGGRNLALGCRVPYYIP